MSSNNPFRQPLRRKTTVFRTKVWNADEKGKDNGSGKATLALSETTLWLDVDFSVPLAWVIDVERLGPGVVVSWENKIDNDMESAAFCVRTMFGYDQEKADELAAKISDAVEAADPTSASQYEVEPDEYRCETCDEEGAETYDFELMLSALYYFVRRTKRSVLCKRHARGWLVLFTLGNLLLANFGLSLFVSPVISARNVLHARSKGAVGSVLAATLMFVAMIPYLLIGWFGIIVVSP